MKELKKAGLVKTNTAVRILQLIEELLSPDRIEERLLEEVDPSLRGLIRQQLRVSYQDLADDWSSVRSTFDEKIDEAVSKSAVQIKTAGEFKDRLVLRIRSMPQASADDLTSMIRREFGFYTEAGARRIGQTTATAATGLAQNAAFEPFEGVERWLTQRDLRRRASHAAADGQQKKDGYYLIGGYQMQYPGDSSAPAREVVNCRCTQFFEKS